jgi:serine/threonine protein kinase
MAAEIERNSVATRDQYTFVREIITPGNFHEKIWLLKHKTTGQLVIHKEFKKDDILSGFAAREITHLIRLGGGPNICAYKEHELNVRTQRGALVMQVYEYGDLETLLGNHIHHRKPFPEIFVWHVLISLSQALLHMQRGSPPSIRDDYEYILHRDIYLSNTFLGPPSHHRSWPPVVLGDLGSSISKTDVDAGRYIQLRQQPRSSPPPGE